MSKHHSGQYYVNKAERAGLRVENGRGDHVKIYGPADRGYMVIPMHRELSNGVERAVIKWLLKLGIILTLAFGCAACYLLSVGLIPLP